MEAKAEEYQAPSLLLVSKVVEHMHVRAQGGSEQRIGYWKGVSTFGLIR